ncbi:MAG: helicase-associated domain-containing protein [Isosphaeraceae bacterium]|nr:helicase-associated domain-containing protein [Isosphaeraceae bacterium]
MKAPKADAAAIRAIIDKLVAQMVLFEDLRSEDAEILIGLLPAVRQQEAKARGPRPLLRMAERLAESGPTSGVFIDDLRTFLLEVASEPPRLKQDRSIFQKDSERFTQALEPLPLWLAGMLNLSVEQRLQKALNHARWLRLVKERTDGDRLRLHLAKAGHKWLASGLDQQYASVYEFLRATAKSEKIFNDFLDDLEEAYLSEEDDDLEDLLSGYGGYGGYYGSYGASDLLFLGVELAVLPKEKKRSYSPYYLEVKPKDREALREAIYQALAELPMGEFVSLESFLEHATFGPHNPLLLGRAPDEVTVSLRGRLVHPLEEQLAAAGTIALADLLKERLIPLGAVWIARDEAKQLFIARHPRLDAYFGRKVAPADLAGAALDGQTRVIVQPDFSVVVIGLNPAPAAELAPFCERAATGRSGQGAQVLKITRDSVTKAVMHGLTADEILARLQRHSAHELPANVVKEVRSWGVWVRRAELATLTVLRCRDRETADRVAAALGKQAERVGETIVGLPQAKLGSAERAKLQAQGILVEGGAARPQPATRRRGRRHY